MNAAALATFLDVPASTVQSWAQRFAAGLSPGAAAGSYSTRDRTLLKRIRDWKQYEPGLSDFEIGQRLHSLRDSRFTDEPQQRAPGHLYYAPGTRHEDL